MKGAYRKDESWRTMKEGELEKGAQELRTAGEGGIGRTAGEGGIQEGELEKGHENYKVNEGSIGMRAGELQKGA